MRVCGRKRKRAGSSKWGGVQARPRGGKVSWGGLLRRAGRGGEHACDAVQQRCEISPCRGGQAKATAVTPSRTRQCCAASQDRGTERMVVSLQSWDNRLSTSPASERSTEPTQASWSLFYRHQLTCYAGVEQIHEETAVPEALRSPAESMIALLAIFMSLSDGAICSPACW